MGSAATRVSLLCDPKYNQGVMMSVASESGRRLFVAADTYIGLYDQDESKWLVQFPQQCYRLFQGSAQVTVGANSRADVTVSVPLDSGYRAIGVWHMAVSGALVLQGWTFSSSVQASVAVGVRNVTASSVTQTITVYLMCVSQSRFVS